MLSVKNLKSGYGKREILHNISFDVKEGNILAIIGPNGSGKTTLLKSINNIIKPTSGTIYFKDKKISALDRKEIAKIIAVVSQINDITYDFTVEQIVTMGRYPHQKDNKDNLEDKSIVEKSSDSLIDIYV